MPQELIEPNQKKYGALKIRLQLAETTKIHNDPRKLEINAFSTFNGRRVKLVINFNKRVAGYQKIIGMLKGIKKKSGTLITSYGKQEYVYYTANPSSLDGLWISSNNATERMMYFEMGDGSRLKHHDVIFVVNPRVLGITS